SHEARLPARRQARAVWRSDGCDERVARGRLSRRRAGGTRRANAAMTRAAEADRRWLTALRWSGCLLAVLSAHAFAFALIVHWRAEPNVVMPGGLPIAVALAPVPVAPETKVDDAPPAPVPSRAEPE